jgi:hypothetical protein
LSEPKLIKSLSENHSLINLMDHFPSRAPRKTSRTYQTCRYFGEAWADLAGLAAELTGLAAELTGFAKVIIRWLLVLLGLSRKPHCKAAR